ncbi:sigma-B regulation protein RsbU (phosphoserine phosphatase) [Anoxybacillus vitaminiphilus]|uniref:Sigma-B regulation protein RsbU (Phosphoserine phosphatase) n=1 Tax=Paranoxybacillus vitaminiphilus TaxID=581036 RepID=A0A327YGL6_9BACL|nr:SpoIIE family protein phosphatase [Anoxybacillus vitaminiphilus]RAK18955.1 sigma-B regulation protein RsbU (phosphoserine phosphatase) [Anoxybacillus vitaminiphilus]
MNIMVIDDHQSTTELIKKMLEMKGHGNVTTFVEIEDALHYLGFDKEGKRQSVPNKVDIILTDILMPKMTGIEFCRLIKQHPALQHVPILMITAYDNEQFLQEAFQAGAFDYIRKPFTLTELDVRLQQAIKHKKIIDKLSLTADILEEQKQFYQSLFYNNSDACFLLDVNGDVVEVNEAAVKMTGYEKNEWKTISIQQLIHADDMPFMSKRFADILKGQTMAVKMKVYVKSGQYKEFVVSFIPVKVSNHVAGMIAIAKAKDAIQQNSIQRRLETDLALAKKIQEEVLSAPIENADISIIGQYFPSMKLSGDMYCWQRIDEHRYSIILIDVMGHGVAASLIGMSIRSLLPGLMKRVTDPIRVTKELNRHVFNLFKGKSYFTSIYLVIDTKKRTIEYLNAGHPPGIFIASDGTIKELVDGSVPIGLMKKMICQKGKLSYEGPTQIFLYTDGLLAAFGKNLKNCHEALKSLHSAYRDEEHYRTIEAVQQQVAQIEQTDDISLISIRINS